MKYTRQNVDEYGLNLFNTYQELTSKFYRKAKTPDYPDLEKVMLNRDLIDELGLNYENIDTLKGLNIISGNLKAENSRPISQAYAGHQFGYLSMLGDGRAMLIGEHLAENGILYDIAVKGSGRNTYSRGGDGKAVLGPMLREYIISEAMNALGIETTRSLAVLKTGETVLRNRYEDGAVLTRVAKSHIRVGTFQYAIMDGDVESLRKLADYTIKRHYAGVEEKDGKYLEFFRDVMDRQAKLIAKWQSVGFIHGVMNTDNVSICGETIDYGPCAFMDRYDPDTVFSSIDRYGRYKYENQPVIARWNMARLAEAIAPLIDENIDNALEILALELMKFQDIYDGYYNAVMAEKIGFERESDDTGILVKELLNLMYINGLDYTNTFRDLSLNVKKYMECGVDKREVLYSWKETWIGCLKGLNLNPDDVEKRMKSVNPYIIPRNEFVEDTLSSAESDDYGEFNNLLEALKNPYDYSGKNIRYTEIENKYENYVTHCGT